MGVCQSKINQIESKKQSRPPKSQYKLSSNTPKSPSEDPIDKFQSEEWTENINIDSEHTTTQSIMTLTPPSTTPSLHISVVSTSSTSSTNSNSQSSSEPSKLLLSIDTLTLSAMVKYIMQTHPSFKRFKNEAEINETSNAFIEYDIDGEMVITYKRADFINELPWTKTGKYSRLYKHLRSLSDDEIQSILHQITANTYQKKDSYNIQLPNYLKPIDLNDQDQKVQAEIGSYDKHEFATIVYIISFVNDSTHCEALTHAVMDMEIDGEEFIEMRRIDFIHALKDREIKGGTAAKLYKILNENKVDLHKYLNENNVAVTHKEYSSEEIADLAVVEFQESARSMLEQMNENMKDNIVNGLILSKMYGSKQDLDQYLTENLFETSTRQKCMDILCNLIWNDKDRITIDIIKDYNRKQLLRYFISLFMFHVKNVIIDKGMNEKKCLEMKRKEIVNVIVDECGFGIGVATNIVDKIYDEIGYKSN